MNSIIIAAAGRGERFGAGQNKLLADFGGKPLIFYTLSHVMESRLAGEIVLVTAPEERALFAAAAEEAGRESALPVRFADGGATRLASVASGLAAVSPESEITLIHDGARPGVPGEAFDRLIRFIQDEAEAALYCVPAVDTVKETGRDGNIIRTLDRSRLVRAQTPQGARTALLKKALAEAERRHLSVTDDMSLCEACGIPVRWLQGKESYFKITVPEDRERWMEENRQDEPQFRVGQGYDIHRFAQERPLILGGVRIRDKGGLLGHSDADVLIHAVMDALLGAAGCRDIGYYFPDTDDRFLGARSADLLAEAGRIIGEKGYAVGNVDSTILAEAPKIGPHIGEMKKNMAEALHISPERISIKATTNETLGAIGRREGIAALASALLYRRRL